MFWDRFAKIWRQFMTGIVSSHGAESHAGAGSGSPVSTKTVGADAYDDAPPTPYLPDYHEVRSDSSLHTSS